jgi:hypothetical protein
MRDRSYGVPFWSLIINKVSVSCTNIQACKYVMHAAKFPRKAGIDLLDLFFRGMNMAVLVLSLVRI